MKNKVKYDSTENLLDALLSPEPDLSLDYTAVEYSYYPVINFYVY